MFHLTLAQWRITRRLQFIMKLDFMSLSLNNTTIWKIEMIRLKKLDEISLFTKNYQFRTVAVLNDHEKWNYFLFSFFRFPHLVSYLFVDVPLLMVWLYVFTFKIFLYEVFIYLEILSFDFFVLNIILYDNLDFIILI